MADENLNLKQIFDQKPIPAVPYNALMYFDLDPYDVNSDAAALAKNAYPSLTNAVYVSTGGSNANNNGTQAFPYADPSYAMTQVTGTAENPVVIVVAPGFYEVENLSLKPFVSIFSYGFVLIQVNNPVTPNSSWIAAAAGAKSTYTNLQFIADFALDFSGSANADLQIIMNNFEMDGVFVAIGKDAGNTTFKTNSFTNIGATVLDSMTADLRQSEFDTLVAQSPGGDSNFYAENTRFNDFLTLIHTPAGDMNGEVVNCDIRTKAIVRRAGGGGSSTVKIIGSPIADQLFIDGIGSTTSIDSISYPLDNDVFYDNAATPAQVIKLTSAISIAPSAIVTLTSSGGSIETDASLGTKFVHTLTENTTLEEPTNLETGQWYQWMFIQAAAAKTLDFHAIFEWPGGTPLTISTGSGDVDIISGFYDGTVIRTVVTGQAFS